VKRRAQVLARRRKLVRVRFLGPCKDLPVSRIERNGTQESWPQHFIEMQIPLEGGQQIIRCLIHIAETAGGFYFVLRSLLSEGLI
jgi:hypothetical protein